MYQNLFICVRKGPRHLPLFRSLLTVLTLSFGKESAILDSSKRLRFRHRTQEVWAFYRILFQME